jgi:uncharacterized membrane-anchored protein
MTWKKARDATLVLTVVGALGLLPPVLPFFDRPVTVFGMPLIVVYVFGAWLALIVLARWLSHRLPRHVARETTLGPADEDAVSGERPPGGEPG